MPTMRWGRPRPFALAVLLAAVLAACSGDVVGDFPSPPPPAITASPTPELDQGFLAEIPVEGSPCFLAEAGGRVWVTAFDGNELIEIDPDTNEVVDTYPMPEGPCGMEVEGDTLWVESPNAGAVVLFDPRRARIVDRVRVRGGLFGLTSTPSGLWGLAGESEEIVQIDPRSRRIVGRVAIEPPLAGIAVDGTEIWTISGRDELVRIDPESHTIAERFRLDRFEPEGLAIGGDTLWVSSSFEGEVLRVDRNTGRVRDRLPVDGSLFGGIVIGGSYWVSSNDGTVYRLDATSGEVTEQLEQVGFGPVPAAGNLWTVDFISNTVYRLDEPAP
jgi:outer membrane protein assembly factor BamB